MEVVHSGGGSPEIEEEGAAADEVGRAFYFDLSSPECWLAAEQVLAVVPQPCEWIPVSMPFDPAFRCAEEEKAYREDIERAARAQELQNVVWPDPFPFDSDFANRAATYLKEGGKVVGYTLAAFRQAFCGGRPLSAVENVMIAAAAVETHPRALLIGADTQGTKRRLTRATEVARERGVTSVPALWTGDAVVHGRLDASAL
ncbi:MAG TPA: DsbA family protein [Solirubrobacteraceae bacterium]|nr:DsbA family protein [Solirubrobacteraceae bacterium]